MLIDTHCHLDFEEFSKEIDDVVARASKAGVSRMITISTQVKKLDNLLNIANCYDNVFCTVGTHPNSAHLEQEITSETLVTLSKHPKIVGIGEVGLDYHYDYATPIEQKKSFLQHILAARETQLPLIIHARNADVDMQNILMEETKKGTFPFILHCYSSGMELAKMAIDLGGFISFSGILTFKTGDKIREIAKIVPQQQILVETDAPFLAPVPFRGKTNEPAFVKHTATVLADTLGLPFEELAKITTDNAFRLFTKMT